MFTFTIYHFQFGVLIAAYRRYYGNYWYKNSTYINELGYLLCGFSSSDLQQISPETFKELNIDVLGKLVLCDVNQTKVNKIIVLFNLFGKQIVVIILFFITYINTGI